MIVIDKLCYQSGLRYTNATEKFAFAILTLVFCVVSHSIAIAILVFTVMGILTVKKGGIPLSRYISLMKVPMIFLLLSTLAIIFNFTHTPLDAFAIPIGSYYLTGSFAGLYKGIQLILTALASVSCLYFLSLSTPVTDILEVLRELHVPQLMLELMLLIYRFIFVMLELASAITTSQHARLGNQNIRTALSSFAAMISSVFILSIKRSNALFDAMESRCYDSKIQVLPEYYPAKRSEILQIAVFELFLFAATVVSFIRR
jgi:cobalt/nickel transport system permease protein